MNKLTLVFAVAAFVLLSTAAYAQGPFSDVPADHWAYAAVKMLQDNGLLEGYPDGEFKGSRTMTRYEMAMLFARAWYKIEENMPDDGALRDAIERLANEFRSELADLGLQIDNIMARLDEQQSEIDRLKSMIHTTNVTGNFRVRTGGFVQNSAGVDSTGAISDLSTDIGHELFGNLNFSFMPNDVTEIDLSFVFAETHGPIAGMIPSANSGSGRPSTPPMFLASNTDSPDLDVAKVTFGLTPWLPNESFFGNGPILSIGRQYFSFGEFGLTGDNGFWSDFGYRFDTNWGNSMNFWAGVYRLEAGSTYAGATPNNFIYAPSRSFQNTNFVTESDDFVIAGFGYKGPEGTVPGHDNAYSFELSVVPEGWGSEFYVGGSASFEIPWMANSTWFNGIRGEGVWMNSNIVDRDPDDLGLDNISWVGEIDIFNNGATKFAGSYAQISALEGIPAYANVDNDPFSEWDYTVSASGDAFNFSREGKNFFPADFNGFGATLEHTFASGLFGKAFFYDGERRNSRFTERPGLLRVMFKYPIYENATIGLDVINAGLTDGLDDTSTLVRGELLLNF